MGIVKRVVNDPLKTKAEQSAAQGAWSSSVLPHKHRRWVTTNGNDGVSRIFLFHSEAAGGAMDSPHHCTGDQPMFA